ncbi:MAG: C69 family dipeptidase [Bacteroidota bacterium]
MTKKNLIAGIMFLCLFSMQVIACTNFIISKGATKDGSTMISYSADSHVLYGELYFKPAADYADGAMFDVYEWDTHKYLGKIKQVNHTYSVVGNMNEYQVGIGETTFGGKEELQHQPSALVDYGSLIYLALQRSKTAREAIKVMGDLVAEYGYYSEGESFSISDANEVWILEMIGKGKDEKGAVWVAQRIPDGCISGHANQARITTFPLNDPQNCIYSADVITFARKKGYFNGEDKNFSFSDIYAPVNFEGARFCEGRVWSGFNKVNKDMGKYLNYAMGYDLKNRMPLWIKPDRKLSVQDVMDMMRDHFEGTAMDMNKDLGAGPYTCGYRWRPLTWKVDSVSYFNERAVSTQQTGFSFITQSRSWMPNPIGGINWFGVDDTYSTVYAPLYCGITRVPASYAEGNGSMMEFNDNAAFWVFNQVSNFAYTRYSDMIPEIKKKQKELEDKYMVLAQAIDGSAVELYKTNPKLAVEFITDFSVNQGENTVKVWKELYAYLFTKYMDGNIKEKDPSNYNPKVKQPGYGTDFYRKIVKETGDKFKVPEEPKH